MSLTQNRHPLTLSSPLGDALVVRSVRGREALSEPYAYEVEIEGGDGAVDFGKVVGKGMAVGIARTGADPRWVHGVVTRFSQGAGGSSTIGYRAELRPWLWLLTLRADCRIFQRKSVPEILEAVFGGYPVKSSLKGTYEKREFCVQYRESDFDFAARLMEEEGISYFFEHTRDAHTLVLVDDTGAHPPCPALKAATYRNRPSDRDLEDEVVRCDLERGVATGKVTLSDYFFETPATSLKADSGGTGGFAVYDYPGGYTVKDAGERRARLRSEAWEAGVQVLAGASTCRAFTAGYRFSLQGHPRQDANATYVLRSVTLHADQDGYANEFDAIPADTPFRPLRHTPRPVIPGTQTAVVVGKSGEEIWTDKYGRVKVQFHWDREGTRDENSSCWVRVAQGWAGTGWGSWVLPRIGQEVVVSFLEGDPDRPLVTGCVYNATHAVPYALPGGQTRSTFRSNSSPGGAAYNEIRLEDKKDEEELYLHAGRDLTVDVKRNRAVTVTEGDDTLAVKKGKRDVQVKGDESLAVEGKRTLTITGDETHTGKAKFTQKTGGDYVLEVTGNLTLKATGSITIQSGTALDVKAGTALTAKGGTSADVQAGTTLTAKGTASTEVSSSGITTVKGTLVKLNG